MKSLFYKFLIFWCLLVASLPIFAIDPSQYLTLEEFKSLLIRNSKKVNLFANTWKQNPKAQFFGGTTRDYIYWMLGQLSKAESEEELLKIIQKIDNMEIIDIRSFIIGESDVDIIKIGSQYISLEATDYGVNKIDLIDDRRFDPKTELGQNEMKQGYIPVEKIRLDSKGFIQDSHYGDGLDEIWNKKLTINYTEKEVFNKTYYASKNINHPVLLTLRYIRLLAMDYHYRYGNNYPNIYKVLRYIDSNTEALMKATVQEALSPTVFKKYLNQPRFVKWLNGSIQKAFRSYANPTVAMQLMEKFEIDKLAMMYSQVKPFNQYLFAQSRDSQLIDQNLKKYNIDANKLFIKPEDYFSNLKLYHGVKGQDETAFRNILFQGIIESYSGTAGSGLYGVPQSNINFAIDWAGSKEFVVEFDVNPKASIVDIKSGYGQKIFQDIFEGDYERFQKELGVDIIIYPYTTNAVVVKNSSALLSVNGYKRKIMPLGDIFELVSKPVETVKDINQLVGILKINRFNKEEIVKIIRKVLQSSDLQIVESYLLQKASKLGDKDIAWFFLEDYMNYEQAQNDRIKSKFLELKIDKSLRHLETLDHLKKYDEKYFLSPDIVEYVTNKLERTYRYSYDYKRYFGGLYPVLHKFIKLDIFDKWMMKYIKNPRLWCALIRILPDIPEQYKHKMLPYLKGTVSALLSNYKKRPKEHDSGGWFGSIDFEEGIEALFQNILPSYTRQPYYTELIDFLFKELEKKNLFKKVKVFLDGVHYYAREWLDRGNWHISKHYRYYWHLSYKGKIKIQPRLLLIQHLIDHSPNHPKTSIWIDQLVQETLEDYFTLHSNKNRKHSYYDQSRLYSDIMKKISNWYQLEKPINKNNFSTLINKLTCNHNYL